MLQLLYSYTFVLQESIGQSIEFYGLKGDVMCFCIYLKSFESLLVTNLHLNGMYPTDILNGALLVMRFLFHGRVLSVNLGIWEVWNLV